MSRVGALLDVRNPAVVRRWCLLLLVGAAMHFGSAALRADALFPAPRSVDFASYYAGAWSMRSGVSPYDWSPALIATLVQEQRLPADLVDRDGEIPGHNSPPPWAWLLVPITMFSFTTASWIWLLFLVGLIGWSTVRLARIAGYRDLRTQILLFPVVLTFSPVFLSLILGQNSLFLLVAALVIGPVLSSPSARIPLRVMLLWVLAIGAKLFPVAWLGALVLNGRWRLLLCTTLLTGVAFGGAWLADPEINDDYWFRFLPSRTEDFSARALYGDQSLGAWLSRIAQPHTADVYLLASEPKEVTWSPPWSVSTKTVHVATAILLGLLGLGVAAIGWRSGALEGEGFFYLVVLFGLLFFPHMARYNHVLALPAMAWLWRRGSGVRGPIIIAYLLLGLSRLINPVVVLFGASFGVLASGVGVVAIALLGAMLTRELMRVAPRETKVRLPPGFDWIPKTSS